MFSESGRRPEELTTNTGERWRCICEPARENTHYLYSLKREGRKRGPLSVFIALWPHPRIESQLNSFAKYAYRRGNYPVEVVFIYGLRAKSKEALATATDPVGPRADDIILKAALHAQRIYCIWSELGPIPQRTAQVVIALRRIYARLECFNFPDYETGTPHDPSLKFRIRSPMNYNYWPALCPLAGSPELKMRSAQPKERINEVTQKPWFGIENVSYYGLFKPGHYCCPYCRKKTRIAPERLHGDHALQNREFLPEIAYAFEQAAPESRWGLSYDFRCKGCDRPVRIIYDVCERHKMSGKFFPGISRVLEIDEHVA